MKNKRFGRVEPTLGYTLTQEDSESKGQEAVDLYNLTGRVCLEWQANLLFHMMALDDEGLWVHSSFGYSVPRQNGKNEVVAIRELWGLQNGERILHTAHRTTTSRAAWERLIILLEASGIKEVKGNVTIGYKSSKTRGLETIELTEEYGGGRICFRTRTTTGGLGETFDLLVIDEAQEYQDDQESALKYTIVSSQNPQTILLGTPPTTYSSGTIFPKYRRETLAGNKKYSGWFEWGVETETDPNDVDAWYETNPSLGHTLSERAIEVEIGTDDNDFNIQRLGLWIRYNQKSAISELEWDNLSLPKLPTLCGNMAVGIKFNKDGTTVALSIAVMTSSGDVFTECVDRQNIRDGLEWLVAFCVSANKSINKIVIDGQNRTDLLIKGLSDAGIAKNKLCIPTTTEFVNANAKFEANLYAKRLYHMEQPAVKHIVTNCDKRAIGTSGGFGYKSIKIGADIAILDSIILATWAVEEFEQKKRQRISY